MNNLVDYLLPHFVIVIYEIKKSPSATRHDFFSAFILEIEGHWLLCTAGHVEEGMQEARNGGYVLDHFQIIDDLTGNRGAVDGYPIPYDTFPKAYVDDECSGDYGLIYVNNLTRVALEKVGKKAIPATEVAAPSELFDSYFMLGQPTETFGSGGNQFRLEPTLIKIERIEKEHAPKPCQNALARFFGRLPCDLSEVSEKLPKTVHGMSGGPIFGIKKHPDGHVSRLIAIQSGQCGSVVTACFAKPLVESVGEAIVHYKAAEHSSKS